MAVTAPAWADFTAIPARPSASLAPFTAKLPGAGRPAQQIAPPPDVEAFVRAAREEGRREGEARAAQAADQALVAQAEAHAGMLVAERRRWAETEASVLAAAFAERFQILEGRLAQSTARALLPFLADGLRREALRELQEIVAPLTEDGRYAAVSISGPEDLVSALAAHLGLAAATLVTRFDAGPDVRVQVDDTVIETRLRAWGERLGTLVEDC